MNTYRIMAKMTATGYTGCTTNPNVKNLCDLQMREIYTMQEKYRYIKELDYFNAIACLAVILIHVLGIGVDGLRQDSWQMAMVYLPWRLAAFVVPAFLFSGAVKMSVGFHWQTKTKYKNYVFERCKTILLPYVIFCFIYYFVFLWTGMIELSWKTLAAGIFLGNISSHFYYIIIVVQFYLLQPVWEKMTKNVPWYVAILCSLMISFFFSKLQFLLDTFGIHFEYMDRIFPVYLYFWVLGLYVGKYYDSLRNNFVRDRKYIYLSVIIVFMQIYMSYYQHTRRIYTFAMDYFKVISDTLSILILLTLCIMIERRSLYLQKVLKKIGDASYFVYLCHCLFIAVVTFKLQRCNVTDIGILLVVRAAIGYIMPFALYFVYKKCKTIIKNRTENVSTRS